MDKYIKQLCEKLRHAAQDSRENPTYSEMDIDPEFLTEIYLSGKKIESVRVLGIYPEELPPVDRLSDAQAKSVYYGMIALLRTINNEISLPFEMPIRRKYAIVKNLWPEGFKDFSGSSGNFVHDFCTGNPDSCELGEYCGCLNVAADGGDFVEISQDSDPLVLPDHGEWIDDEPTLEWDEYEPIKEVNNKYVLQLIDDINCSLDNLIDRKTYHVIYGERDDQHQPVGPVKSLAEWLDLEIGAFPSFVRLNGYEMDAISKAIMSLFDDEVINTYLPLTDPMTRYKQLIHYLGAEMFYNGDGTFTHGPLTREKSENTTHPLDSIIGSIKFNLDDSDEGDEEADIDLPF